jgi:hypothetical protein
MVARYGKIEMMGEIMATYRRHPGGTWSSRTQNSRIRESTRMLKALDRALGYRYTKTIRQTIAPSCLNLAVSARESGKRIETVKHFVEWIHNGGLRTADGPRAFASLLAYIVMGPLYRLLARSKSSGSKIGT